MIKQVLPKCDVMIINDKKQIKKGIESPDEIIIAYVVFNEDILYYAYTKYALRHKGFFKVLLDSAGLIDGNTIKVRHLTPQFVKICEHKNWRIEHYPFV